MLASFAWPTVVAHLGRLSVMCRVKWKQVVAARLLPALSRDSAGEPGTQSIAPGLDTGHATKSSNNRMGPVRSRGLSDLLGSH